MMHNCSVRRPKWVKDGHLLEDGHPPLPPLLSVFIWHCYPSFLPPSVRAVDNVFIVTRLLLSALVSITTQRFLRPGRSRWLSTSFLFLLLRPPHTLLLSRLGQQLDYRHTESLRVATSPKIRPLLYFCAGGHLAPRNLLN